MTGPIPPVQPGPYPPGPYPPARTHQARTHQARTHRAQLPTRRATRTALASAATTASQADLADRLITLGAVGLGFGLIVAFAYFVYPTQIESVEEGDCVSFAEAKESFAPADCASTDADYRVYRIIGYNDASDQCVDVPGVTKTYELSTETLCIGDKDADLAASINGITVGECVKLASGADQNAQKSPCAKGTYPVILVLRTSPRRSCPKSFPKDASTRAPTARATHTPGVSTSTARRSAASGTGSSAWDRSASDPTAHKP